VAEVGIIKNKKALKSQLDKYMKYLQIINGKYILGGYLLI
jgi:hypothetical protein